MIKLKISFFLINLGIRLLPNEFKNKGFIINCIHTEIIKINQAIKDGE